MQVHDKLRPKCLLGISFNTSSHCRSRKVIPVTLNLRMRSRSRRESKHCLKVMRRSLVPMMMMRVVRVCYSILEPQ